MSSTTATFFDGSLLCANPVYDVFEEAEAIWPDHARDAVLVSIGTAQSPTPSLGGANKKITDMLRAASLASEAEAEKFLHFHASAAPSVQYFRFSAGNQFPKLDKNISLAFLEASTESYLSREHIVTRFEQCATALAPVLPSVSTRQLRARLSNSVREIEGDEIIRALSGLTHGHPHGFSHGAESASSSDSHLYKALCRHPTYISWMQSNSPVLWLHGPPGVGKTYLCLSLSRHPEASQWLLGAAKPTLLLTYFCSHTASTTDFDDICTGLLVQLLGQCPEILAKLKLQKWMHPEDLRAIVVFLFEQGLKIVREDSLVGGVTCIVDGLDELDSRSCRDVLVHLQNLVSIHNHSEVNSPYVRFVISSRRSSEIAAYMHDIGHPQIHISDLMEEDEVHKDIGHYIDQELRKPEYDLLRSAQGEISNKIVKASNGMFLWVRFILQELKLKDMEEASFMVTALPKNLSDLYGRIIDNVPLDNHRARVVTLLGWIAVARRPMTLRELSPALPRLPYQLWSDAEGSVREELQYCMSFCTIKDKTVFLSHASVREYILRDLVTDKQQIEVQIIDKCFECLLDLASARAKCAGDSLDLAEFPLLDYALYTWPEHARSVQESNCLFLEPKTSFYDESSPDRAAWLELYEHRRKDQRQDSDLFPSAAPRTFTSLHLAAYLGLERLAEWLGPRDVNTRDDLGRVPLVYACYFGHFGAVKALYHFAEVDQCPIDYRDWSLIHYAAAGGQLDVVVFLLQKRCFDVSIRNGAGDTPLHIAAAAGQVAIMGTLLSYGADVLADNALGRSSLHSASLAGQVGATEILLDAGADLDGRDYKGRTPLHGAAQNGNEQLIHRLLDRGAYPLRRDSDGATPLAIAASDKDGEAVYMMLKVVSVDANQLSIALEELRPFLSRGLPQLTTDPCRYISSLLGDLPNSGDENVSLCIEVQWEVLRFIEEQLSGEPWTIQSLLTLSGNSSKAVAQQCKDYMCTIWPNTGAVVLQLLTSLIAQSRQTPLQSSRLAWAGLFNLDMTIWPEDTKASQAEKISVEVSGTRDQVIEVTQQFAWVACVFRPPIERCLGFSTLHQIRKETLEQDTLLVIELSSLTAEDPEAPLDGFKSDCWQPLFRNSVIAYGFPVPARGEEFGLDIAFEVMTSLAGIKNTIALGNGTLLIGPTAAIYAVDSTSDSVQWHRVERRDDDFSDMNLATIPERFRLMRTFLGFCRAAEVVIGTALFNYADAAASNARYEKDVFVWKDNAFTVTGTLVSQLGLPGHTPASLNLALAGTLQLTRGLQANRDTNSGGGLDSRLITAKDISVIVYDCERKTGWLVPEASVALWLAHAFIRRRLSAVQPGEVMRIQELCRNLHASEQGDGGPAAFSVMLRNKEARLWSEDGEKYAKFKDVIEYIFGCFDTRRNALAVANKQLKLKERKNLCGWEVSDIVEEMGTIEMGSYRREVSTPIYKASPTWWRLGKDPKLLVLFSAGLPDLVRPAARSHVCELWQRVPPHLNLLTASNACLIRLAKNYGFKDRGMFKLSNDMGWNQPSDRFYDCGHQGCNPIQTLSGISKLVTCFNWMETDAGTGAVTFGNPNDYVVGKHVKTCQSITVSRIPMQANSNQLPQPADITLSPTVMAGAAVIAASPLNPMVNRAGQTHDQSRSHGFISTGTTSAEQPAQQLAQQSAQQSAQAGLGLPCEPPSPYQTRATDGTVSCSDLNNTGRRRMYIKYTTFNSGYPTLAIDSFQDFLVLHRAYNEFNHHHPELFIDSFHIFVLCHRNYARDKAEDPEIACDFPAWYEAYKRFEAMDRVV